MVNYKLVELMNALESSSDEIRRLNTEIRRLRAERDKAQTMLREAQTKLAEDAEQISNLIYINTLKHVADPPR